MNVLLIAPIKASYGGLAQYPPVGLGYLATSARKSGHRVTILDCVQKRMGFSQFEAYIQTKDFDVIGITAWSLSLEEVQHSLRLIKKYHPNTITIIGGPHPSAIPEKSLEFFIQADFAFRGEGEIGFIRFLDLLQQGSCDYASVPGLIWRKDGEIKVNAPVIENNLDLLGFPSWDLINPRDYFMPGSLITQDTAVLTCTRGCPYQCTFCSAWIIAGKKIRQRSVKHILEEIAYLSQNHGIKIFDIPDENFTFDKEYVMQFCEAVFKKYGRGFEFFLPNGIRLDSLDREVLGMMRKANFRREVAVGIESGSERILKLMKKNLSVALVKDKVKLMNEAGFRPIGYFILGFPGETKEDIEKTIKLALELKLSAAAFTPFAPMPGTEATNELIKSKELPEDFDFTQVTSDKVAYAPRGLSREEVDRMRKMALLRFNLRPVQFFYYIKNYNSFRFALAKFINLFIKGGQV